MRFRGSVSLVWATFALLCLLGSLGEASRALLPIPEPKIVQSNIATAGATVDKMYVSHAYDTNQAWVVTNGNMTEVEAKELNRFVHSGGTDNSRKSLILIRYNLVDSVMVDEAIAAKKAGFASVQVVVDLNGGLEGKYGPKQASTIDFESATLKDTPVGAAIKRLREAGFKFNDSKYGLFGQPLHNRKLNDFPPIMHEKEMYLVVDGGVEFFSQGSANLSSNNRFNRIMFINDPVVKKFAYEHAQNVVKTFRDGGNGAAGLEDRKGPIRSDGRSIVDIPVVDPIRVVYKDGSYQEMMFTDGKFNPNDRITDLFERAAAEPNKIKVKDIIYSHFVLTKADELSALHDLLQVQTNAKFYGIFDDRYIDSYGPGVSAAMAGYFVTRERGAPFPNFSPELTKRLDLNVYQRGVEGAIETTLEGSPYARHLWHDKTTIVTVTENGEDWCYIFTGSFNNSNHIDNAEMQIMYRVKADSDFAKGMIESIKKVVSAEKDKYVFPMELAALRNTLSRFFEIRNLEISYDDVNEIVAALKRGDFGSVSKVLKRLSGLTTTLDKKPDPKNIASKLELVERFFKFYAGVRSANTLSFQKFASALNVITVEQMLPIDRYQALNFVFKKSQKSDLDDETISRSREIGRIFGLEVNNEKPGQRNGNSAKNGRGNGDRNNGNNRDDRRDRSDRGGRDGRRGSDSRRTSDVRRGGDGRRDRGDRGPLRPPTKNSHFSCKEIFG